MWNVHAVTSPFCVAQNEHSKLFNTSDQTLCVEKHLYTTMSTLTVTCSFGSHDSPCGLAGNNSTILPLGRCDNDMTSHLKSLGISLKRRVEQQSIISEVELILNRAGFFDKEDKVATMTICPKHRREFTSDWPGRKRRTCSHPQHSGQRKQMKNFRRVNAAMSEEIFAFHKIPVPIGSGKWMTLVRICCVIPTELFE